PPAYMAPPQPMPLAPPPAPQVLAPPAMASPGMAHVDGNVMPPPSPPAPFVPPAPISAKRISAPPPPMPAGSVPGSQPALSPRSTLRPAAASEGVVDSSQAAAHRNALITLMDRALTPNESAMLASGDAPSPQLAQAIERMLSEKASQMRINGELPAD